MEESATKRQFEVANNYAPFIGKKLSKILESAVNLTTKETDIIHLNDFGDGNFFAVRAGKYYNELIIEEEDHLVTHAGFVELVSKDEDKKKVRFAIWNRLKSSKILR